MQINGPNGPYDQLLGGAGAARDAREAMAPAAAPPVRPVEPDVSRGTPRDSVSISPEARALADQMGTQSPLAPERMAEIRQRILEGAYDTVAVAGEVARRVLASGDV